MCGIERERTALFAELDHSRKAFRPRKIAAGEQAEIAEVGLERVALENIAQPAPAGPQFGYLALGPVLLEQFAAARIERQIGGQFAEYGEIEKAGPGGTGDPAAPVILLPCRLKIGRRHLGTIRYQKLHLAPRQRPVALLVAPFQTTAQAVQVELRDLAPKADTQILERQIGGHPALTLGQVAPQAHGTMPARQMDRVVDPGSPAGEIGIGQLDENPSRQVFERFAKIADDFATDVDARRQFGRGRRREAEAMVTSRVVETELQILEHQRRRAAQAVFPENGRISDADAFLIEHPVGECRDRSRLRCRRPPP